MTREKFEEIAEEIFNNLPEIFSEKIDNIHIVIEDSPNEEISKQIRTSKTSLLGLYQGIPLTSRGTWYGTNPTIPDKITLYKENIEAVCRDDKEISEQIRDTLLHELGHYFGMSETEIRKAMKNK